MHLSSDEVRTHLLACAKTVAKLNGLLQLATVVLYGVVVTADPGFIPMDAGSDNLFAHPTTQDDGAPTSSTFERDLWKVTMESFYGANWAVIAVAMAAHLGKENVTSMRRPRAHLGNHNEHTEKTNISVGT